MTDPITFTVPGIPCSQPRQRHRILTIGGKQIVGNYTPAKAPVNDWKAAVRMSASSAFAGAPLDCPVEVEALFVFPRPKRLIWKKREMRRAYHDAKPDAENVAKALLDSLSKLLFRDDAQVCSLILRKVYASGDEQPHTEVVVRSLDRDSIDRQIATPASGFAIALATTPVTADFQPSNEPTQQRGS